VSSNIIFPVIPVRPPEDRSGSGACRRADGRGGQSRKTTTAPAGAERRSRVHRGRLGLADLECSSSPQAELAAAGFYKTGSVI
jgi:hypothetical protein